MDFSERFRKRFEFSSKLTHELYKRIVKIDTVKGQWKLTNKLSPQMIKRLQSSVLITSTGASTRIEGSKLSDRDVEKLFNDLNVKKLKTRDQQEVGGYLQVLEIVFESWEHINFSESTILGFHNQLLKYSKKDIGHCGKYKKSANRIEARDHDGNLVGVIFEPTSPHLVQKEMGDLVEWTNQELEKEDFHPLLIVANFVFEFLAIHPFDDGNGRLSRVLTNLLLLQNGYPFTPYVSHEKIIEDNKSEYYLALSKTQKSWKTKHEDITSWLIFFLDVIEKQSNMALKILSEERIELFLSEKQLMVWEYALSCDFFQRADVINGTKLNHRTVEEAIKKLLRMNKIEKFGEGKATRYKVCR